MGSNLASAATLAARAGINDVIALLKADPSTASPKCNSLLAEGQALGGAAAQLGSENTKYTCILIDKTPAELAYQNLTAYKSRLILISPSRAAGALLFSWQSTDRSLNQAAPSGLDLLDETDWGQKQYAPLLRLSLYRVPSNLDLNNAAQDARSFWLYPQAGSGSVSRVDFDTPTGSLKGVKCGATDTGAFSGSADYDCNVIVGGLATSQTYRYYVRLTPIYVTADLKIKANDGSSQPIEFSKTQYTIDVTAKSGQAVKRLQAQVEATASADAATLAAPGDDALPEFSLRSAMTVCKRLLVDDVSRSVTVDPASQAYCNLNLL